MRRLPLIPLLAVLFFGKGTLFATEQPIQDPVWALLHDPHMLAELKLSEPQRQTLRKTLDELDLQFLPVRNGAGDEAAQKVRRILAELREKSGSVLQPEQQRRLAEVALRAQRTLALLRPEVAKKLEYSEEQRAGLQKIIREARAAEAALMKQGQEGKGAEALSKEWQRVQNTEIEKISAVLSESQQARWREMIGKEFDFSKLGRGVFKTPELTGKQWLNSQPLQLAQLRGQVVVVHFYTSGCANCARNFPHYRAWQDAFAGQGVVIIGIHTPESEGERVVEVVRKKSQEEKFVFPIVIDNEKQNWNAWGNSVWPTVYLIDKQGYISYFWIGELNGPGAKGEELLRRRITELLAE